jgi:hypothetical protein
LKSEAVGALVVLASTIEGVGGDVWARLLFESQCGFSCG